MKRRIKKILKEDIQKQFLNKIILLMKDDYPIYKKLDDYGFNLSDQELIYVLSGIFGETVEIEDNSIYDDNGNKIYYEDSYGFWIKQGYDQNGNQIYYERSDGFWEKWGYDENGNKTYYERSDGLWIKYEYDDNGNQIYYENSNGLWIKREYDEYSNKIYYEDSNGYIEDNR